MKPDLSVKLGNIKLRNPIILASGTCSFGEEITKFLDLNKIGAITTKTITLKPKEGNPPPRIVEVENGIINSIGLENPGVKIFVKEKLPFLQKLKIPFFVSVSGETEDEFAELAGFLDIEKRINAIELNLSCPNLKSKTLFGQDKKATYNIIKKVKKATSIPVIAKLTPQVKDITEIALACQKAGCDIISLINTIPAMAIDINSGKPFLGGVTGGLSGPAIKPIALKMVYDTAKVVDIPIIGCGGIMTGKDAIEFMLAGASAISIGTANLASPDSSMQILKEIESYLVRSKINSVSNLTGKSQ